MTLPVTFLRPARAVRAISWRRLSVGTLVTAVALLAWQHEALASSAVFAFHTVTDAQHLMWFDRGLVAIGCF